MASQGEVGTACPSSHDSARVQVATPCFPFPTRVSLACPPESWWLPSQHPESGSPRDLFHLFRFSSAV